MPILDDPAALALLLSPAAVLVLVGAAALVEYLFPPFWGDLLVLLGFFFAGQGKVAPWAVFLVAFVGSGLGAAAAWGLGRRYGLAVLRRLTFSRRMTGAARRVRLAYQRFGEPSLAVNRFVPFARALMLPAAGALGLRFGRSVGWASLSNLLWLGVLASTGVVTGGSWERIQATFRDTSRWTGLLAAAVALAAAALLALSRREDEEPSTG